MNRWAQQYPAIDAALRLGAELQVERDRSFLAPRWNVTLGGELVGVVRANPVPQQHRSSRAAAVVFGGLGPLVDVKQAGASASDTLHAVMMELRYRFGLSAHRAW